MSSGKALLTILVYSIFTILCLSIWNNYLHGLLLKESNFLNWDAEHYFLIKEIGYEGIRIAFFPLFPFLWKLLQLSIYGGAIMNGLIFLISFFGLSRLLKLSAPEILLFISIPSFIFFYLPYSESVFFACSFLIIYGLQKNNLKLILAGLFLASLARPAFTVFFPALVIVEFLQNKWKVALRNLSLYFITIILGLLCVGYIQYLDTGEWFKFFSVQKHWGNFLQIPQLPLSSWSGNFIIRLDGAAFLIGIMSGLFLTAYLIKLKSLRHLQIPAEVIFSLAYLGGITLSVLLFRGGSLFSLNRFVFTTPFVIVVMSYWLDHSKYIKLRQLFFILLSIIIFWFLFGSWAHIQTFLMYSLLSLYIWLIFGLKSENSVFRKTSLITLILLNISFQLHLFYRFFLAEWVG